VWYAARAGGIVAFCLLSASVALGFLLAGRTRFAWPRFAVEELHRTLSLLTGVFLAVHGGSLLVDRVVPFSLAQELVPFTAGYRPFAVGLGVLAADVLAAVAVTNALRRRIPHRVWRRAHYLTIPVWLAATAHLLLAGTDRGEAWLLALVGLAVGTVALCGLHRLDRALPAPPAEGPARRSTA
jgi:sulfoxide reductase heme-binding subunit YedZ